MRQKHTSGAGADDGNLFAHDPSPTIIALPVDGKLRPEDSTGLLHPITWIFQPLTGQP
jgi:hypothetical protein